jgi:hypothetical protein
LKLARRRRQKSISSASVVAPRSFKLNEERHDLRKTGVGHAHGYGLFYDVMLEQDRLNFDSATFSL